MFTRLPLKRQLIVVLVVPALLVLAGMAHFADSAMKRALDKSLGERLIAVARSAATIVNERVSLLEPGDDDLRIVKRTHKKLHALIEASQIQRILVLSSDRFHVLVDSDSKLQINALYPRARFDQSELREVQAGRSVASVLFRGPEGRWYKSAYAPLGNAAVIVVHAPAKFFASIDQLRTVLVTTMLIGLLTLILLAFVSAKRVTIPLLQLTESAKKIGQGDLQAHVPQGGPQETQILGNTMSQMAKSLFQRDEEMQMMLGGIAHEVRNPLGGIELFASLLEEDLEGDEAKLAYVEKILKEIRVLSTVVNDFLAFARKHTLNRTKVHVYNLLQDVTNMANKDAQHHMIDLRIQVDRKLTAILDHQTIRAALLNLVRNAIQASPPEESVELNASAQKGRLRFEICDHGDGVPANKVEDIFTPFFTTKQKGTGLGLAMVQKTVAAHSGKLTYEDRKPKGARFIIDIPADTSMEDFSEPGLPD